METLNYGEYVLPLFIGKLDATYGIGIVRYAGAAYFLDGDGKIATCGHLADGLAADEFLAGQDLVSGAKGQIKGFRKHPKFDFAIGYFHEHRSFKVLPHIQGSTLLGLDVQAFGYTADGAHGNNVKIIPRLFKGSIVGHGRVPSAPGARYTVELSFASHKGFSGAPLFTVDNQVRCAGMLFSNHESTIEQYSYREHSEPGKVESERIYKVVELGIAHSPEDIQQFLEDFRT